MMQHLVFLGVPGEVASIISAAIYDRANLDPAFGTRVESHSFQDGLRLGR